MNSSLDASDCCTAHIDIPFCAVDLPLCGAHIERARPSSWCIHIGRCCNRARWSLLCRTGERHVSHYQQYHPTILTMFDSASADTLYICYCIDKDTGDKHRDEVFSAVGAFHGKSGPLY